MEAPRDLVRRIVEFSARMQHGHDDFGGGAAFFGHQIDRDPPAVVGDRH